jgi:hypothetical protein
VQNGDEDGIDCGGLSCAPCTAISYIVTPPASPTNVAPIDFKVSFSQSVLPNILSSASLTLLSNSCTNCQFLSISSNGPQGTDFTVSFYPVSDGLASFFIPANLVYNQGAGNAASLSYIVNFISSAPSFNVSVSVSPTRFSPKFVVSFDRVVSLISPSTVSALLLLYSTNAVSVSIAPLGSTQTAFLVTVLPRVDGYVAFQVPPSIVVDAAGNANRVGSGFSTALFVTQPPVYYVSSSGSPTNTVVFIVTFSAPVIFTNTSLNALLLAACSNALSVDFQANSTTVYTIRVQPISQGVVTFLMPAALASDVLGNLNAAAVTPSSVVYDSLGIQLLCYALSTPTYQLPVFSIYFSEPVSALLLSANSVLSGCANCSAVNISGSGQYFSVTVTPLGYPGPANGILTTVSLNFPAGIVYDAAGNPSSSAACNSAIVVDTRPLSVSVAASISPTNSYPVFLVKFSKPVLGFSSSQIGSQLLAAISGGSAVSIYLGALLPLYSSYQVIVTPQALPQPLSVTMYVPASICVDATQRFNLRSNNVTIVYNTVGPTYAIARSSPPGIPTRAYPVFTIQFTDSVFTFGPNVATTSTLTQWIINALNVSVVVCPSQIPNSKFNITVTPVIDGNVTLYFPPGIATDSVGNGNLPGLPVTILFAATGPAIYASRAGSSPTRSMMLVFNLYVLRGPLAGAGTKIKSCLK